MEGTDETIIFLAHIERGFGVPVGDFFRSLLFFYRIELVHLVPNSITIICTFIHLCEAYLGIAPHLYLRCFFFKPKKTGKSRVVGRVGFMLRWYMKLEYIKLVLSNNTTAGSRGGSTLTTLHRWFQAGLGKLLSRTRSGPSSSHRERRKSCTLCWTTR
jgi:hypothetical protein